MINKLAEFGHTFQVKSVACLMKDSNFIAQIYDILDESHYDSDGLKWIVKECKKYFDEYKKPITLDVFKVKTNEVNNDILKTTIVETLKEVYRYMEAPDLEFIQSRMVFHKTVSLMKQAGDENAPTHRIPCLENASVTGMPAARSSRTVFSPATFSCASRRVSSSASAGIMTTPSASPRM